MNQAIVERALTHYRCRRCGHGWYIPRTLCPRCGAAEIASAECSGRGVVEARTTIFRAPSPDLQQRAPYAICLVRMSEGFLVMARCATDTQVGQAGTCRLAEDGASFRPAPSP